MLLLLLRWRARILAKKALLLLKARTRATRQQAWRSFDVVASLLAVAALRLVPVADSWRADEELPSVREVVSWLDRAASPLVLAAASLPAAEELPLRPARTGVAGEQAAVA
jgi:hypothetical protein